MATGADAKILNDVSLARLFVFCLGNEMRPVELLGNAIPNRELYHLGDRVKFGYLSAAKKLTTSGNILAPDPSALKAQTPNS